MDEVRWRPGQHGPRRSFQLAALAWARRLGVDEERVVAELRGGWPSRGEQRRRRVEVARRRDLQAYIIYVHYLRQGLHTDPVHVYPHVPIPDALLARVSRARRMLLPPGMLAEWAYRIRVLGESAENVARRENEAREQAYAACERALRAAERALADAEQAGDPVEITFALAHVRYLEASVSPRVQRRIWDRPVTAAAVRQAVKRHRYVWELAEHQVGSPQLPHGPSSCR
jgi:hypothetical protein